MSTPEEVAYQRRLAEAARRKAVQKAAQQAVNAARTSGLKVSLQLAKQARREAHSPYAGQRMMWVNGFRNGDGTWTSGHWRRNPNPAIAPAALEASKAAAGARGVAPAIRDLMARAPLMDRHLDARGLQRQYQGRLAPWQRGDWAYKGQEARAGGRPQDPMQPVINDVAGALNPGIVGLGIASAVNSVRASAREGEWGAVAGEVGLVAATAAVPMAPKGAQLDALGRYSRLRRAAEQLPDKAPAEQMLGILRNAPLSPEEITWTNTDKFLVGATMAEHDAARTASGPSAAAVKRSAEIAALGDKIRAATGDEKKALIARRQELAAANKAEFEADIAARARAKAGANQPDPASRTVTRDDILRHLDESALKIVEVKLSKKPGPGDDGRSSFELYSDHALRNDSYRERLYKWQPSGDTPPTATSHWPGHEAVVVHTRTATETSRSSAEGLRKGDKTHDVKEIQSDWGQRLRDVADQPTYRQLDPDALRASISEMKAEYSDAVSHAIKELKLDPNMSYGRDFLLDELEVLSDRVADRWKEERLSELENAMVVLDNTHLAILEAEERLMRIELIDGNPVGGPYIASTGNTTRFAIEQELINAARNPEVKALTITRGAQVSDRFNHNDKQRKGTAEFYNRIVPKVLGEIVGRLDPDAKVLNDVEISNKREGTGSPRTAVILTPKLRERILKGLPLMSAAALTGGFAVSGSGQADARGGSRSLHAAAVLDRVRRRRAELRR